MSDQFVRLAPDSTGKKVATQQVTRGADDVQLQEIAVTTPTGDSAMDDTNDAVRVNVVAGSAGGPSAADDSGFGVGADSVAPIGALADESAPDAVDEGDVGIVRMTLNRALHVSVRDVAGDSCMDEANNALKVNVVAGSGSGTEYTEDAAAAANPQGGAMIAVRADTLAAVTDADGDNVALRATNKGELNVKHADTVTVADGGGSLTVDGTVSVNALPAGTNNIGDVDVLSVPAPLNVVGAGTEAAAMRVTLANDSTGLVSVDDNGGSLTVDGTVGVSSLPAIPAGTNNIGDVDVLTVPAPLNVVGSGTEAAALRVTLPTDGTGQVKIVDGGGSITVDGAVSVSGVASVTLKDSVGDSAMDDSLNAVKTTNVGANPVTDGADSAIKATVLDYTNSNPLAVRLTDISGDYVAAGAGTQYAEDTAHVDGDLMQMAGVVQKSADAALSNDGDRSLLQVDSNGYLKVNVKAGSSAGSQYTEDAASASNPVGNQIMGRRRDNPAAEVDADGDVVAINATDKGELYVKHIDVVPVSDNGGSLTVDGSVTVVDGGGSLTVDGSVSITGAIPAGTNNIGDVDVLSLPALAAGTNNIGDVDVLTLPALPAGSNKIGAVDTDADATIADAVPTVGLFVAGTDGTNARALKTDASGELQVDVLTLPSLPAGNANIGDVDVASLPALPAGSNNIGDVDVLSLPALVAGSAKIGAVDTDADATIAAAVPSVGLFVAGTDGTNARGLLTDAGGHLQVDVTDILVELPAGSNNIGDVDVLSLPALPAGTNNIGDVDVLTLPALVAGTANIGDVDVASIAAGDNNIGNVDIVTMPNVTLAAGTNTNEVVGDVAHDIAAAGNPLMIAGVAETPDDSAPGNQVSAEGDSTRIATDRDGAVYTHQHPPRIWHVATEYTTQQTDATVKAAPGSGLSLYVTDIYIAVNAAVNVTLEEGTTTLKWRYYGNSQGQGVSASLKVPIKIAANTALTITTSGAVTCTVVVCGYTAP